MGSEGESHLVRCAFFEGRILPGHEAAFRAFVADRLLPIWRQFPGALSVDVLYEVESEAGGYPFPMVLQIAYPDRAAIEAALASPVRAKSRALTQELMAMFEGRIFHVVFTT
jgi:quinol monooxygenase YgiN